MKKLLLILLCLPMIGFGQQTYVPDDNFEQALIDLGYDSILDNYVTTSNINSITFLDVSNKGISDLTGIEGFNNLEDFGCSFNQITYLDVSANVNLDELYAPSNPLLNIDISGAISLTKLILYDNNLSSIDLSNNTALTEIYCQNNNLISLDISSNPNLTHLWCTNNQLMSLDLRNGNNFDLDNLAVANNSLLECIDVDNPAWSTAFWTVANFIIDPQHYFSNNCSGTTSIQEQTINKELLKVTDLLVRETKETNQPLFYIYDDGTVEKRIVIE